MRDIFEEREIMARQNKIISSPYYTEIHERLASGEKIKDVEQWYNSLPGIPDTINYRTFQRYFSQYIKQEDKIKIEYNRKSKERAKKNRKKAKKNSEKVVDKKVNDRLITEDATDAFTEKQADDVILIDDKIKEVSDNLDIMKLTPHQQAQFLVNLINAKYKIVSPTTEENDFNLFTFFTEDDGDILDDVRSTDE